MKKIIIPILAMLLWQGATAQTSLSLYYMDNVPQTSILNAARQPRCNMFIALPGVSFRAESNIKESELFQNVDGEWHSFLDKAFDYSDLNKRFKKGARINTQTYINVAQVGLRKEESALTVGIAERIDASMSLPTAFVTMLDKGFADGTTLDFSNMRLDMNIYRELSLGFSIAATEQLTVGGRFKFLSGFASVKTDISKFEVTSGRDQWLFNVNSSVSMSYPLTINKAADGTFAIDSVETKDLSASEWVNKAVWNFKNPGVALDLGAEYKINENFKASAALNDLGVILWTDDMNTIHSNCSYTFDGVDMDLDDFLSDGTDFGNMISEVTDSIKSALTNTVSHDKFTTRTRPNLYLGAEYTPSYNMSFGFVSQTTFWKKSVSQNFNLSVNLKPYTFVGVTTGLNLDTKGCCTADFGFSLNLGPIQYYLMTNGIPIAYRRLKIDGSTTFAPYNVCDLTISTGFNIILGAKGFNDKAMNSTSKF